MKRYALIAALFLLLIAILPALGEEEDELLIEEICDEEILTQFFTVQPDEEAFIPSETSPFAPMPGEINYWTLPMDITDEEAVWEMLIRPITVLDTGKNKAERAQITLRSKPDINAPGVGVVTCISQGVRVIREEQNGWTLIECYSSSFHDSEVKAYNQLVQGYVQSKYLRQAVPDQEYGIVIDKLTQRLYLFRNGHLFSTLLVSTGLVNDRQPWNETRSGEFLMLLPAVGGFADGNMTCNYAIRFNSGDLLHEVPHNNVSGSYATYEPKLGQKASHGCIRVQRRRTPQGINMQWIWEHKKNNIKLIIWEDWPGRQISYPEDDLQVYYNPNGGTMYHSAETCYCAKGRVFTAFSYGDLDESPYRKLKRCEWCAPPLRKGEIDEINAKYTVQ